LSGKHEVENHHFWPEPADVGRAARHAMRCRLYLGNIDGVHGGAAEHRLERRPVDQAVVEINQIPGHHVVPEVKFLRRRDACRARDARQYGRRTGLDVTVHCHWTNSLTRKEATA
jgi:hypothetical protein